jgi:hypothetical protein
MKVKDTTYTFFKLRQLGRGWFRIIPHKKKFSNGGWVIWWFGYRITKEIKFREI